VHLITASMLSPEYRMRNLNDIIEETMRVLSSEILTGSDTRKYKSLIEIYGYFRDRVDGVETYQDMLDHLGGGKTAPAVLSFWIEERMITADPKVMEAVRKGSYDLSVPARVIIEQGIAQAELVTSLLQTLAAIPPEREITDTGLIDACKGLLLPKPTLCPQELADAESCTQTLELNVRLLDPGSPAQLRRLLTRWATEFPGETSLSAEQYASGLAVDLQKAVEYLHNQGGG
jgi:hypothetical protein